MTWLDASAWSFETCLFVFLGCVLVIGVTGTLLTAYADRIAARTGIGEAVTGAVLLGAATSMSGSILSATAAWHGRPELAMANAIGGISVQTAFLAVADISYRRANLEHAAASTANMMQGALLCCLLAIIVGATFTPDVTRFGIHPATPILLAVYLFGMRLAREARVAPMWHPEETDETRRDMDESDAGDESTAWLFTAALFLMVAMGSAGWLLERSASELASRTGITQTVIGGFLTSTSTSIPELVTSLAAVRRGALTLAVGGILGGNAFDTLFAAVSDIAYRPGSIYHAVSNDILLLTIVPILMTGILLLGLLHRQKHGPGGIGFESIATFAIYAATVWILLA